MGRHPAVAALDVVVATVFAAAVAVSDVVAVDSVGYEV